MEAKHTPTPWDAFTEPDFSGWWAIRQKTEDGLNHEVGSSYSGLEEADAKFIVRAVNSHDALVLALKRCLIRIEEECADPEYLDCVISAKEVLALAGEKP